MRSAEFLTARELYREFEQSPYRSEAMSYLELIHNLAQFVRSKRLDPEASRQLYRRLKNLLPPMEAAQL